MKVNILRFFPALTLIILLSCASTRSSGDKTGEQSTAPRSDVQASAILGTAFGSSQEFVGSPYEEIGINGLFDVHPAETCRIAVLPNGDDSFERNFEYFLKIKESRGIFNTNIYWEATRNLLDETTKVDMDHVTDERLNENVRELADKKPDLKYEGTKCRFFQTRPRFGETYIEQAYLKSIKGAENEILIGNAYFIASTAFIETVKAAARRCVKVIIITNSPETNDLPMLSIVGREYYDDILAVNDEPVVRSCDKGGVEIWEWQGRRTNATEQTEGIIHAKYAVLDRRVSVVGSYNLDPRSRTLNSESAIVFENENLSRQLSDMFYENDLDFSKQITLEDTKAFTESADAVYQLQKEFGIFIQDAL